MTGFILAAIVLLLIAMVMVIPTLLKKNQPFDDEYDALNVSIAKDRLKEIKQQRDAGEITAESYQQLHDELEATLALDLANTQAVEQAVSQSGNQVPLLVAIAIPVLAAVLYWQLGDFNAATGQSVKSVEIPQGEDRPQMTIEEAIAKLQKRLQDEPENAEGWFMLAKTYMTIQQYPQAAAAYQKTIELMGDDPQLLLRYADAVAMSEGGRLTGAARPIVEKVVKLIPDSPTVLWMAGSMQSQLGNHEKALALWYKLRPLLAGEPQAQGQIDQLISEAETQLGAEKVASIKDEVGAAQVASAQPASLQATASEGAAEIIVTVELDPQFRSQVSDSDTLFIFAKAIDGPPMPLAAVKQTVSALPLTVSLTDAMAMMPQMKLSSFEQVKVSAVVSKSGQPGAKAGDLYAEVSPVKVQGSEQVKLVINQVK